MLQHQLTGWLPGQMPCHLQVLQLYRATGSGALRRLHTAVMTSAMSGMERKGSQACNRNCQKSLNSNTVSGIPLLKSKGPGHKQHINDGLIIPK